MCTMKINSVTAAGLISITLPIECVMVYTISAASNISPIRGKRAKNPIYFSPYVISSYLLFPICYTLLFTFPYVWYPPNYFSLSVISSYLLFPLSDILLFTFHDMWYSLIYFQHIWYLIYFPYIWYPSIYWESLGTSFFGGWGGKTEAAGLIYHYCGQARKRSCGQTHGEGNKSSSTQSPWRLHSGAGSGDRWVSTSSLSPTEVALCRS